VLAAYAISFAGAFLWHLLAVRSRWLASVAAVVAAATWLVSFKAAEAWLFRREQIEQVAASLPLLAHELAAAHADSAAGLVDAGLAAETGKQGVAGALAVEWKAGVLTFRVPGHERRMPLPPWGRALWLGGEAAFVAVVVRRALRKTAVVVAG
jgi:hypothetical protein